MKKDLIESKFRMKYKLDKKMEELIKFKDLIKLLTCLIDLFNDLIEGKLSLKVN